MQTNFSNLDIATGVWKPMESTEYPSTAVPKVIQQIAERAKIVTRKIESSIRISLTKLCDDKGVALQFQDVMKKATAEISLHARMLDVFTECVMNDIRAEQSKIISGHPSSRTQLQKIGDQHEFASTGENFRSLVSLKDLADTHERVNNDDAINLLAKSKKSLNKIQRALPQIEISWNEIVSLDVQNDPELVLETLDNLKKRMKFLERNQSLEGIKDALKEIPDFIEISPSANPSPELCLRKFGELHASIRQKRFELSGLKYLEKYFSEELAEQSATVRNQLTELLKAFINVHEVSEEDKKVHRSALTEENMSELELSARLLENSLLTTEPGKKFFEINTKLHTVNRLIAERYSKFPVHETLQKCSAILGSELFTNFVTSCTDLMFALRQEQSDHPDLQLDEDTLRLVGIATSKTNNMIDSYVEALEEILAPLSNFMGNSLHALIKEMLKNTPLTRVEERIPLRKAFKLTGRALWELNRNLLTNSTVLKQ